MVMLKKMVSIIPDIIISINLSPRQMLDDNFKDNIKQFLEKYDVNSRNIAFEITETAYIENIDKVRDLLKQLNDMGFVIYLDDFGTGYSSLSYLHQLPIQTLKIDKLFIDSLSNYDQSKGLISSLIALAKVLNIKTVAEGVETKAQFQILSELGCDAIQGYYFDRPMDGSSALNLLSHVYEDH